MRIKRFAVTCLCLISTSAFAQGSCEETDLYRYMDDLKTELKSFSFEVKTGNLSAASSRLDVMLDLLGKSRAEEPFLFREKGLEGDELALRQSQYEKGIDRLIGQMKRIETAIAQNDTAAVKGLLSDVGKSRKKGHRAFNGDC
ncbi:MAG: cytochrome b562 [Marinomonas sp.]